MKINQEAKPMNNLNTIEKIKDLIKDNKFVMIYFSSNGCNVCENIMPRLEEILIKYSKIVSGHVEVQNLASVASVFSVYTIPTIVLFLEEKEVLKQVRFINFMELEEQIKRYEEFL